MQDTEVDLLFAMMTDIPEIGEGGDDSGNSNLASDASMFSFKHGGMHRPRTSENED